MLLKDIIKLEEKLLKFEDDNKFNIDFNDYLILDNILKNIGSITTNYFLLIKKYDERIIKEKYNIDEHKKILNEYNDKLLLSNIEINEKNILNFMSKYNIL